MNAFVLAGGKSTRMGRDKALLDSDGRPLLVHALDLLRSLGLEPRICASRSDLSGFAPVVADIFPDAGPLGGIEAALSVSDTDLNIFLPVDMPGMPREFLRWMTARAEGTRAAATVPRFGGQPQPLCAVYSRRLDGSLRSALARGEYKVMAAIAAAAESLRAPIDLFQVEWVAAALPAGQWPSSPPLRSWFRNLNTPSDLSAARARRSLCVPGAGGSHPIS